MGIKTLEMGDRMNTLEMEKMTNMILLDEISLEDLNRPGAIHLIEKNASTLAGGINYRRKNRIIYDVKIQLQALRKMVKEVKTPESKLSQPESSNWSQVLKLISLIRTNRL